MTFDLAAPFHLSGLVLVMGLCGMLSHYLKKFVRKEIEGSLLDYFVHDHGRASIGALVTLVGAVATAIFTHMFDGMAFEQVVMAAFTLGYTCDSAVNQSTPALPPPLS